jgi:hypothetical protein
MTMRPNAATMRYKGGYFGEEKQDMEKIKALTEL